MYKTVNSRNHDLILFDPKIRPLSSATTPGQSGPGSDDNKGVLRISQSSSITGTWLSDCFVSYPGHSLGGVLLLCREAIGVFYSPSRLGKYVWVCVYVCVYICIYIHVSSHSDDYNIGLLEPKRDYPKGGWTLFWIKRYLSLTFKKGKTNDKKLDVWKHLRVDVHAFIYFQPVPATTEMFSSDNPPPKKSAMLLPPFWFWFFFLWACLMPLLIPT